MIVSICGSMVFADKMQDFANKLEVMGHECFLPVSIKNHLADKGYKEKVLHFSSEDFAKLKNDHFQKIQKSDAILVINIDKNGVKNYIGSSTFGEMNFAHSQNKKIFLLNDSPDIKYINDDLKRFDITVLNGEINQLI